MLGDGHPTGASRLKHFANSLRFKEMRRSKQMGTPGTDAAFTRAVAPNKEHSMKRTISVAASLALAFAAAPLGAQILPRGGESTRTGTARDRMETAQDVIDAARRRAGVYGDGSGVYGDRTGSRSSKVPPGHRPPPGMCRIWIDGVPPGQQPAPTDCATAERNRTANSRVIYGDQESFPGKGKGKFKNKGRNTGTIYGRDGVYERDGRIYDRNGRVIGTRNGGIFGSTRRADDDSDSDSDRRGKSKVKASKSRGGKSKGKGR